LPSYENKQKLPASAEETGALSDIKEGSGVMTDALSIWSRIFPDDIKKNIELKKTYCVYN